MAGSVSISRRPDYPPQSVKMSFKDRKVALSWAYAKNAWSTDNRARMSQCDVRLSYSDSASVKSYKPGRYSLKTWAFKTDSTKSAEYSIPRGNFYPHTSVKVKGFAAELVANNPVGFVQSAANVTISAPRTPTISASFNASTGVVSFGVKTNAGTDGYERYDTRYRIVRQDSSNRNNSYKTAKNVVGWATSQSTDLTATYDVADHASIAQDQWIKLTCYAYARGLAGDSATASKSYLIAHPAAATISGITATSPANGTVTVKVKTNASTYRPVTRVRLQRLVDTTIGTKDAAASATGWEDVDGAVDNASCSGFTDQKSEAMPQVRRHTWYRVVSTYGANAVEGIPVEAACLYRARDAASAQAVKFPTVSPSEDGTSVSLKMGWATDDYTATQVAWAGSDDAWESNEQPSTYVVDWEDASPSGYAHTAGFVIRGLEPDEDVYIRARRVKVEDDKITLRGEWCNPAAAYYPIEAAVAQATATLYAPASIVRGDGIDCQWEVDGGRQGAWYVYRVDGGTRTLLRSGADATTARCVVDASKLEGRDSVSLQLLVKVSGANVYSEVVPVTIYDVPTLSCSTAAALAAQPMSVTLSCSTDDALVNLRVTALEAVVGGGADGALDQVPGDVVHSGQLDPTWAASGSSYSATVTLPEGLPFVDGMPYLVSAVAIDKASGLHSDEATAQVDVEWGHQAVAPTAATIDVDADRLAAEVTVEAPEGAAEGDVCDVYRVTPYGTMLAAEGVAFGETVVDRYAPYANVLGASVAYRLCTRTPDGDVAWDDFGYEVPGAAAMRVDWEGGSLELPWNLSRSDSWRKASRLDERWDGARVVRWNAGASHEATVGTTLVRDDEGADAAALAALARYAGACFVRCPDGLAMPCDVSVDSHGVSFGAPVVPLTLKLTQTDSGDFRAEPLPGEE